MSSKKRAQKFHADDVSLPRTVGSVSDWWCCEGTFLQATRSSAHIWAVTRHQYGITAIVPQTSFGREPSGGVLWILGKPRPHKASEKRPGDEVDFREQKSNRIRLAKQQLCTCITLFCSFLCLLCTTTTWDSSFHVLWRTWAHDNDFLFSFVNSDTAF